MCSSDLEERLLPLLTYTGSIALSPGSAVSHPAVMAALRLITAFDRSDMASVTEIIHVNLRQHGVIQFTTSQGSTITLRPDRVDDQIKDWQRIWNWGARSNQLIATLDLSAGRNIPVRWQEPPAGDPSQNDRRPVRPKRTRKSHV